MAQALTYDVPPAPTSATKEDALDDFLRALHESGALRALTGFVGRIDGVSEVLVDQLITPGGLKAVSNLAIVLTALTDLDSDRFSRLVRGLEEGLGAAADVVERDPPNLLSLLRMLNDEDTRRGLHALLVVLQAAGRTAARAPAPAEGVPVPRS